MVRGLGIAAVVAATCLSSSGTFAQSGAINKAVGGYTWEDSAKEAPTTKKDGKPLTFRGVGTTADQAALTLLQSELQQVGINMAISVVSDSQTFTDMDNKSYGIWLSGSIARRMVTARLRCVR